MDVPKIVLELAIADVKKQRPNNPKEMPELAPMQLFATDAVKTADQHPKGDADLAKLVTEFAALCPKQVEKARSRP